MILSIAFEWMWAHDFWILKVRRYLLSYGRASGNVHYQPRRKSKCLSVNAKAALAELAKIYPDYQDRLRK
jgi:hypothetical protein